MRLGTYRAGKCPLKGLLPATSAFDRKHATASEGPSSAVSGLSSHRTPKAALARTALISMAE
jgi:hypothetical protein